ncbi:methyl-accepting chemotaxis protein [Gemmata sp. JC717]|uniref:methyl-accepting chemotaxis protein n=1 Tax=Gemmata algarum TaxID=2975278 RepID=UPI0021BB7F98|nr:methyl-accepting chemotaxis protein [Gemmata algarum]MDY3557137.1 methyl-accepting chemotaxis protein [Gemmata algarum]
MNWLRNMSMAGKLAVSFGTLTALLALAGGIGLYGQSQINERTAVVARHADGLNHLQEANGELLRISRAVRNAILDDDAAAVDRRAADIRRYEAQFRAEFEAYRQTIVRNEQKAKAAELERRFNELRTQQDEVVALARAQNDADAKARLPRIRTAADAIEQDINDLVTSKQKLIEEARAEAGATADRSRTAIGAAVAAGCLLSVALGVLLSRLTARPLQNVMGVLEAVAQSDLSRRAEVRSADEIGRLAVALNTSIDALRAAKEAERAQVARDRERAEREAAAERARVEREAAAARAQAERDAAAAAELRRRMETVGGVVSALAAGDFTQQAPDLGTDSVGQMASSLNQAVASVRAALEGVREVSEQLADASAQLSSASDEISAGAQEQASSLEETASALEEITATVRQNADSAQQARQLAHQSKDIAEKGGSVVSRAVGAMSEINESSKKIADIITTIDEIAFQTNLLALNAAVEAARAGEQGRGFAVVATEVRNLAQRSATAAKEIKTLIGDSVKKVDAGTELVNRSGDTLAEIVTSVKQVTDIVTGMAAAGKEQSAGIEQVNNAVSQMDTATQHNASQTEELSATAQALTDQAGQLRDLIARFRLAHSAGAATTTARAPAAKPKTGSGFRPRPAVTRAPGTGRAREFGSVGGSGEGFTDF